MTILNPERVIKKPVRRNRTLAQRKADYNLDKVQTASPVQFTVEQSPIVPTFGISQDPTDPNKTRNYDRAINNNTLPQTPQKPSFTEQIQGAVQPNDMVNALNTKKTALEQEITDLSERMANIPTAKIEAQKKMGIYEDQKALQSLRENLSGVKQDLLAAQDQDIELRELGKQKISDFAGTSGDYAQLTNEDLRKNKLDQLALSRTYSRLGDAVGNVQNSINDNISAINERMGAEQEKIKFDINQKNKILDRVIQTQGNILSAKQKAALEDVKFKNSLELQKQSVNLETKKMLLQEAARKGYNIADFNDLSNINIGDIMERTLPPVTSGDLLSSTPEEMVNWTPNQWKVYNALKAADTEDKKQIAKRNVVNQVSSDNVESIIAITSQMLSDKNREGLRNSVGRTALGRTDVYNPITGLGKDSVKFRSLADQLFNENTLNRLTKLKQTGATLGALSDNERIMLDLAANGSLGKRLEDGTIEANEDEFIDALQTIEMGQMKTYLAANSPDNWDKSGLRAIGLDTEIKDPNGGQSFTGYELIKQQYEDAKFDTLNQDPISIYNIRGELIGEDSKPEVDMEKIIQIESGGNYNAENPTSGAYGKYQFIPSTLKAYAKKTGQTIEEAKTPAGQEKMFAKLTEDNTNGLKRLNIPVNTASVYLAHQQGLDGARQIIKGDISPTVRRNLLANLPKEYSNRKDEDIIKGWFNTYLPKLA